MRADTRSVPEEVEERISGIKNAGIVVGIPSYNNAATITHVVAAVDAGLGKYFPEEKCVIINSDGGSTDDTAKAVLKARTDHSAFFVSPRVHPVERVVTPYHGIPGKGSAFRAIFHIARLLGARACCVVDADLRSISPEWMEMLLGPVYSKGFDFVAPLYSRHRYDGTITNSIIYPVTRALYGKRIRQPIGGEFGLSGEIASFFLEQDVWDSDVARFGIDIWMTTEALAGGFRVCQSFLGAKIHNPKDPGTDLSDMFVQVVGSLMRLTERHYPQWKDVRGSSWVPTFGFRYFAGVPPVKADIAGMLEKFRLGTKNLMELWAGFLSPEILNTIKNISRQQASEFRFPKEVWVRVIYDYVLAYRKRRLGADHLIKSLVPLYLGRTASFFIEMAEKTEEEADASVEELCMGFEDQKNYLLSHW